MNDDPRIWALTGSISLPLIGDQHPLRQRYRSMLYFAAAFSVVLHLCAVTAWMAQHTAGPAGALPGHEFVFHPGEFVPPPVPLGERDQNVRPKITVAAATIGIPEPVVDFQAKVTTILTDSEMSDYFDASAGPTTLRDGDRVVFETPPVEENPSPTDFIAVEEQPVLVSIPAPVYPDLARTAEVEGVVVVRVLIGKDGRVRDAIITEGNEMLNSAALAAAFGAIFKPAMSQRHPVPVWIMLPIRFTLH